MCFSLKATDICLTAVKVKAHLRSTNKCMSSHNRSENRTENNRSAGVIECLAFFLHSTVTSCVILSSVARRSVGHVLLFQVVIESAEQWL